MRKQLVTGALLMAALVLPATPAGASSLNHDCPNPEPVGEHENGGIILDCNGDGRPDALIIDTDGDGTSDIYMKDIDGDGTPDYFEDRTSGSRVCLVDEDGDGRPDVQVQCPEG